jgi:hypothetical protein
MEQPESNDAAERASGSLKRMVRRWHSWRATVAARKLKVQEARCELLVKAEREYGSSYYTDRLHDAVCHRVQLASVLEYHRGCVLPPNSGICERDDMTRARPAGGQVEGR